MNSKGRKEEGREGRKEGCVHAWADGRADEVREEMKGERL